MLTSRHLKLLEWVGDSRWPRTIPSIHNMANLRAIEYRLCILKKKSPRFSFFCLLLVCPSLLYFLFRTVACVQKYAGEHLLFPVKSSLSCVLPHSNSEKFPPADLRANICAVVIIQYYALEPVMQYTPRLAFVLRQAGRWWQPSNRQYHARAERYYRRNCTWEVGKSCGLIELCAGSCLGPSHVFAAIWGIAGMTSFRPMLSLV